jgi:hypothetical protein
MYRPGGHSVRERIIAVEVMKLEREQIVRRVGDRQRNVEAPGAKTPVGSSGRIDVASGR